MRKALILAGCVLLTISAGNAGAFWIGGHCGPTSGGNLNENSTAFGIQAGGNIDDVFSLEMSGTRFQDSEIGMSLDVTSLALTGLAGVNVLDNVRLYAGAGLDFNMIHANVDVLTVLASGEHMTVDEYVSSQGFTMDQAESILQKAGLVVNVKFNDNVGYHVEAGTSVKITEGFQLFAQYRYTWSRESEDVTTDVFGKTTTVKGAIDRNYGYGLFMLGFNLIM